jgi:hypothetical protein
MRRSTNLFMEALHQARLADPWLSYNQRHLTFTVEGALPAIHQQAQFALAPDKGGQSMRFRNGLEPPSHAAGLHYPVKPDRPFDALERLYPAVFDHEEPRDQPMRCVGNHYAVRFRKRLHPRSYVGSVSEYVGFLARTCAHYHRA